jgi:hypothetical protein
MLEKLMGKELSEKKLVELAMNRNYRHWNKEVNRLLDYIKHELAKEFGFEDLL